MHSFKRFCKEMAAIATVVLVGCMLGSCVVLVRYEKPNGKLSSYKRAYAVRMQNGVDFIWFQKETSKYEQKMVSYVVDGDRVSKVNIHRKR